MHGGGGKKDKDGKIVMNEKDRGKLSKRDHSFSLEYNY